MTTNAEELPGALHELSSKIVELMDDEDVEKIEEPYIIRHFQTFSHEEIAGARITRSIDERTTKEGWNPETYDTIISELKDTEIYEECIDGIQSRDIEGTNEPNDLLEDFIRKVIDTDVDSSSDREVMNQISLFIAHLDGSPISWRGISWINGIEVEDSIRLDETTTIRPPKEEDLEVEMPLPLARHRNRTPPNAPSSILEINERTNNARELDIKRDKILSTLSLFKLNTVAEVRWRQETEGFVSGPRLTRRYDIERERLNQVPYQASVEDDEIDELREFYSNINPIISDKIIKKGQDDFITIAFDRYQNAISDDDSDESRLTSAIMCLEALLLGNEGELSGKLSRRTGLLLGFYDNYHPIEVQEKTKSAYNIRSRYVHGTKIDDDNDVSSLAETILDYSRKSLLTIIQVEENMGKKKLLNKLDEAALHEGPKESLFNTLEDSCTV